VFFHTSLLWLRFENLLQQEQGHIQKQADQADGLAAEVSDTAWFTDRMGNKS
jgi:hypothetical protein